MFDFMELDDAGIPLKPMTVPDTSDLPRLAQIIRGILPVRLANWARSIRYERSGVMHGLLR